MAYYKIRPKSGTKSQWEIANTVLGEREIGFEYPNGGLGTGHVKMKMGDGSTPWNSLPYALISPIVENAESTSTENVPSSNYVKEKFGEVEDKLRTIYQVPANGSLTFTLTYNTVVLITTVLGGASGLRSAFLVIGTNVGTPTIISLYAGNYITVDSLADGQIRITNSNASYAPTLNVLTLGGLLTQS